MKGLLTVANQDAPGGGDGSGTASETERLADDLRAAATDAWISEQHAYYYAFHTRDGAMEWAKDKSLQHGGDYDVFETSDGRIIVGEKEEGENPETFIATCFPRESEAWKDAAHRYDWVPEDMKRLSTLDPSALTQPVFDMGDIVSTLDQGGLSESAEEVQSKVEAAANDASKGDSENADLGGIFEPESDWALIDSVSRDLDSWDGLAAETFKFAYADRLPVILIGQLAIATALKQTLDIAKTAMSGAQSDINDLARANIDALVAYTEMSVSDVNWSKTLQTIADVTLQISNAAALIPHPGPQAISATVGFVNKASGVAAAVVGLYEENAGKKEPKIEVGSGSVDSVMSTFASELGKVETTYEAVEGAAAKLLDAFNTTITSAEIGAEIEPHWSKDPIELSTREAFFEGKAPGGKHGLATMGDKITDDDPGNDPGLSSIKHGKVIGEPGDSGSSFGADLYSLYQTGAKRLPGFADKYDSMAGNAKGAGGGLEKAFTREVLIAGGSTTSPGAGNLYPAWQQLHEEFLSILKGAGTNLRLVGEAIAYAAEEYGEKDTAAADKMRETWGEVPWQ